MLTPRPRNKRHYIAASPFDNVFYSYATSMSMQTFKTTGTLSGVTGATASNCPRGRILREVGNRLYPDAHPGISTMMVQVYDANSGLKGYIDPNAPQFAVFNSDKPVEIVDGGDNNTTTPHKGSPVYTTGDVIAEGDVSANGDVNVGGDVVVEGEVRARGQVRATTITPLNAISGGGGAQAAQNLDPTLGQVFTIASAPSAPASITLNAPTYPPGARMTLIITQTGTNATTFTFGNNMVSAGTYAPNSTGTWAISFISDGVKFCEVSRTTAQA